MCTNPRLLRSLVFVLPILLSLPAAPAIAQVPARSFEDLRGLLEAGDTVYITEKGATDDVEARVLEVTPTLLSVSIDGTRRELAEARVGRIRQRVSDSRRNGALVGALVGAAGTTSGALAMASPKGSCRAGCIGINVLYGGGIGALIGLAVDGMIRSRRDVYVAEDRPRARVDVGAFALPATAGVSVSLRF